MANSGRHDDPERSLHCIELTALGWTLSDLNPETWTFADVVIPRADDAIDCRPKTSGGWARVGYDLDGKRSSTQTEE
jgi:hypothetical protein